SSFCLCLRPPRLHLFPYTTLFRSVRGLGSGSGMQASPLLLVGCPAGLDFRGPQRQAAGHLVQYPVDVAVALLSAELLGQFDGLRSEEHTSELQSRENLVCRLLLAK